MTTRTLKAGSLRRRVAAACVFLLVLGLASGIQPAAALSQTFTGSVDAAGTRLRAHSFTVTEVGTISATLDWSASSADLNLFLKDPSGVIVATSASSRKPESLTHEATTTGTWKINVKAKTGASSYTATVDHSNVPEPPPTGTEDWPMFHRDPAHTGLSTETALGASNAGSMGIQWQANTGQAAYTSPAVVHNGALNRTLVYVGNSSGTMAAYDATTGERVWWYKAGAGINSSPAVVANTVYFGASDDYLYAVNATTGALVCRFHTGGVISSSPVVADPDGTGRLVFIGDNGITGGDDGGHLWAINAVDPNAAANCSLRWMFDGFGATPGSQPQAGVWSPPAFGEDVNGRPLIVFGGSSPDNAVYAVDARTGSRVWRFQTQVFHPDNDVGAGPTISPPGVNGFTDGVAYVAGKNRIVYALNLRTGVKLWEFRIRDDAPAAGGATRSTAALVGNRLLLGYGEGVYSLNATTGAKVWRSADVGPVTAEVISSPAVSGPAGDRVIFVGDMAGKVIAFDTAGGARLWTFSTGGFIYGSPAISGGRLFIASSDGFLYAFGVGGGSGPKPTTTLTSPANGATVPNPNGSLILSGAATDDDGVTKVLVAVKNKNTNKWWVASTGTWSSVFEQNLATLSNPGGTSTSWSHAFDVPFSGGVFFAQAEAVDTNGQHDPTVAIVNFTVEGLGNPPETTITSPVFKQVFHFPDGIRQRFLITVTGNASDTGGATPGIQRVNVVIKNIEHGEHYCGSLGCATGDGETTEWSPVYTVLTAQLADPGDVNTTWTIQFPTYDHPHKYRIVAWAVDLDGEADQTKAVVSRICVRDAGDNACV
jgi:outer membrane protein assembly factor BamB